MFGGIASRLKNGKGASIAAVVERLGAKKTMPMLTGGPLLRVLPEFVESIDDDALSSAIETRDKRTHLVEELQAAR